MSQFERGLAEAKKRQRRLFLIVSGCVVAAAFGLVVFFFSAGGTRIVINPSVAQDTAEVSVSHGLGFAFERTIYSLSSAISLQVAAPGFKTAERQLTPVELSENVVVTLVPLPATLSATTKPSLENTRWLINGDLVHVGSDLEHELEPGTYTLGIDNPYYQPIDQEFTGKRGETTEITQTLIPVDGRIQVSTVPDTASISINGIEVGTGFYDGAQPGGQYQIEIKMPGFNTTEDSFELTNTAQSVERNYRLRPVSARLRVLAEPKGGELLLNGKAITNGKTYDVDSATLHEIVYFNPGYQSRKVSVTLKPEESETVRIFLEEDIGKVDIKSSPTADIYIHDQKVGETPATLKLPAIPIDIELRKDGYRTVSKRVTPTSARTIIFAERLQTELALRLAESPPVYKNRVGMTMKRFKPGAIKMGAPRSQQGQRANEFQKQVTLTKMFYAGMHEVTNGQYRRYRKSHRGQDRMPIVGISWIDAAKFSNWLSAGEKLKPFYRIDNNRLVGVNENADGYRLLTEAEWEWLARKSGKNTQTVFPWGDKAVVPSKVGNIADEAANGITKFYVPNYVDGFSKLAPVGSFAAEPSGLFDLTGNVREWVHDRYALTPPTRGQTFTDPLGADFGDSNVVKGSSWRSGTRSLLRAAYRSGVSAPADDLGFRVGRYLYGGENAKAN